EAMHLVDEEQCPLPGLAPCTRRFEDLFEISNAREHGGDLLEMQSRRIRQQAGDGCLPRAGRSPEDERAERARLQHAGRRAVRPQEMILPHHLRELGRPQPVRKRARCVMLKTCGLEQRGAALAPRAHPPSCTVMVCPPRTSVMAQRRFDSLARRSRSRVRVTFSLFTAAMTSPFWKPRFCASDPASRSTTATPSSDYLERSSAASAGEMLAIFMPMKGERERITISSRGVSGAISS